MGFGACNILGLTTSKLTDVLHRMRVSPIGVLRMSDAHATGKEALHWRRLVQLALGPSATISLIGRRSQRTSKASGGVYILNDFSGKVSG